MPSLINLTGQKFGRLVIISRAENRGKNTMWNCICGCGKKKTIASHDLLTGDTRSCGCYQKEIMSKIRTIDILGNRYGRLVVIKRDSSSTYNISLWLCRCDCGKDVIKSSKNLRNGRTVRCGWNCPLPYSHANMIDLAGKTFGKLSVIRRDDSFRKRVKWVCKCTCGNIVSIDATSLQQGKSRSCGCAIRRPVFIQFYNRLKSSAKDRNLSWKLTEDVVRNITSSNCFYCGKEPTKIFKGGEKTKYIYNGIDRVNSSLGYTPKNCVPCCWKCNRKKSATKINEFKEWIISVYNHWASK